MRERIPERFRVDVIRRIGHGGEATVHELTGDRALRVYHGAPHGANEIAAFYRAIARGHTPFALPEILEQGDDDGVFYSIDRFIPGRPLRELMEHLSGDERTQALASYTDAAFEVASLPLVRHEFGEFLRDDDSIRAVTWNEYLLARMQRSLQASPWLRGDVPALDAVVVGLTERIRALTPARKALVHGDYFPGNVLMSDELTVAGVIDFGPLTVIGDSWLDLASALIFLEVARPGYTPADTEFVRERLAARLGATIQDAITSYRGGTRSGSRRIGTTTRTSTRGARLPSARSPGTSESDGHLAGRSRTMSSWCRYSLAPNTVHRRSLPVAGSKVKPIVARTSANPASL